jgi:putative hemolysin
MRGGHRRRRPHRLRSVILDTSSITPAVTIVIAAAVLALFSAAEASIVSITRRRIRGVSAPGLPGLLRVYVRERQRLSRALRHGFVITTVAVTSASVVLALAGASPTWTRIIVSALAALLGVSIVRNAVRTIVRARPEAWAPRLERPLRIAEAILLPAGWLLSALGTLPLRMLGWRDDGEDVDPAEELIGMLEAAEQEQDAALLEERRMMRGVLEMSTQTVRELMTPRTDVTAVSTEASFGDVMRLISDSGYSRIPLYDGSLDRIVGVVYAKDLLAYVMNGNITPRLTDIARPPYLVPETKRANELLADMRRDKVHLAIAVDEYGGTAGVVTVEDLVEEIVGAITDEYDTEVVEVEQVSEDEAVVDAALTIDELNELFGTEIRSEDFDTVGGLIVTSLGRLAVPGDEVIAPRLEEVEDGNSAVALRVLSILGRRIKKVRVHRIVPTEEERVETGAEAI